MFLDLLVQFLLLDGELFGLGVDALLERGDLFLHDADAGSVCIAPHLGFLDRVLRLRKLFVQLYELGLKVLHMLLQLFSAGRRLYAVLEQHAHTGAEQGHQQDHGNDSFPNPHSTIPSDNDGSK